MIDDKDISILDELKKNARTSTQQIALTVEMPRVTVHDRIQKMIKNKVIRLFTVLPNYEKLGLNTTVFIFIAFNPCEANVSAMKIANIIKEFPGIYEIHIVAGEYDLLIKARGKSFNDIGKSVVSKIRL